MLTRLTNMEVPVSEVVLDYTNTPINMALIKQLADQSWWLTVENENKLIRKYIPKKADFADFTEKKIMSIQKKLNTRYREKLSFETPKKQFFKHLGLICKCNDKNNVFV